jgi:two-component system, cell cycle sensor histidine kinase and response regulator CckA
MMDEAGAAPPNDAAEEVREALRVSEIRFSSLVAAMPDLLFVLDKRGVFLDHGAGAHTPLLVEPQEFIGKHISDVMPPDVTMPALEALRRALATATLQTFDYELDMPDGRRSYEARLVPAGADEVLAIVRDVTAPVRAQRQLRLLQARLFEAQKMESVARLAGGVAHDFNNLLTVILSFSQFVDEAIPAGDPVKDDVDAIRQAATRAAKLTRQLLAFSRRQLLQPEVLDLNDVVSELAPLLRRVVTEDIEVVVELAPRLFHVEADPGQMEQVLMNLASNAKAAMTEGGRLEIRTDNLVRTDETDDALSLPPGDYVRLTVVDTGAGMDEETRTRAFEPFFTTQGVGGGPGLGLSSVHGVVKQSGGDVRISSVPGEGTRVEVLLPRTTALDGSSGPIEVLDEEPVLVGTETVLVAEDDPAVRKMASRILRRQGYGVLEAGDGLEALIAANHHDGPIQLLLTDVVMPRMSGPRLAAAIRESRPDLKVVHMSGYADESIAEHGVLEAGIHLLQKPFDEERLLRMIRAVLDDQPEVARRSGRSRTVDA